MSLLVDLQDAVKESRDHYLTNITNSCLLIDRLYKTFCDDHDLDDVKCQLIDIRRTLMKGLVE